LKQRVDLVRSQLNSKLKTRASRVPKEISPKTGVRQQPTERSLHVSLTHALARRKDCTKRLSRSRRQIGVTSHLNV